MQTQKQPFLALIVILMAWPFMVARASSVAPVVKDEGKFFQAETIKKVNEKLRDLARKHGKDLLVETFPSPPAEQAEKVKNMSREERAKFFQKWAVERAELAVVNGVYVLICKEPTYLQIEVDNKTRSRFTAEDRNKLRDLLIKEFHAKRYDDGLLAAVQFVQEKLGGPKKE